MEKNIKRNESIEIKRILDILVSKKILIAFILIVFTLLGYVYTYHFVVPKYQSTSTLLLIPNDTTYESRELTNIELLINSELITTYSSIAQNSKILKQTINNLGLDMTEKQLLSQMKVNIIEDSYIIEIAIADTNPQRAMELTNELSDVFLQEIKDIYNLNNLGVVDEAQLPMQPYNIHHIKDIAIFLIIGMAVSFAYIMIIYIFDNTLKKEEDIENYIHVKSLGSIPVHNDNKQEIINKKNAKTYITECINNIRTNILYMNSAKNAKTVLVTSCTPQEGKSWVSANIATSFAKTNKKVLLIDADMRKGRAHKIFNVNNKKGLSNYLRVMTGNIRKDIRLGKDYIQETKIPNLHILTNGTIPPNPSELLGSSNMKELIALLKIAYDIIIVDAPPCKLVTDSIVLSNIIDSTILVVNSEKTKIKELNEVKKSIETVGGEIIGAILNKKKITGKTYSESYSYGYGAKAEIQEMHTSKIIPVTKVLGKAILKLEKTNYQILREGNKLIGKVEAQVPKIAEEYDVQEEMKQLMKKQNKYLIKIVNAVNNSNIVQDKSKSDTSTIAEMRDMIRKEMTKIDHTEQIAQMNEMLTDLKDSYLELSNKIQISSIEKDNKNDVEEEESKNIIDFKHIKDRKRIIHR